MTEEERLQWAKDAERNPAIWESFEVLKRTYMQQASLCDQKDDLGRYRYLEAYKDIDVVEKHLKAVLHGGKLTDKQQREFTSKKKFIPSF
jgi:hypothetical protein|tara:strand:- start:1391 stop:1660 length:270 start_codon:yes stop_codon:yes gene_type:complete